MRQTLITYLKAFGGLVLLALIPLAYIAIWADDWRFTLKLMGTDLMTVFFIAVILKALKDKS